MSVTRCVARLFIFISASLCHAGTPATSPGTPSAKYGQLPMVFESNQGQADPAVHFLARGQRYTVALVDDGVQLSLKEASNRTVQVRFSGDSKNRRFEAPDKLPGVTNYLIGNDPRKWIQGVPQYGKIWQRGVYPGIDVAYYGTQGQLEYDFVLRAGADPGRIRMNISGAKSLRIDASGDLILDVGGSEIRQKLPLAWQERDGKRIAVSARYRLLATDVVGITAADYDRKRPLVIDPVLTLAYSTYLGGALTDMANAIAVNGSGEALIAGSVTSLNFPATGFPLPQNAGGSDAFVAKLSPSGTTLLYATYLGGSGNDQANGIAVDQIGNAYITGSTASTNFPTLSALRVSNAGGMDAFAAKLNSNGTLAFSTYLGGNNDDSGLAITVDLNSNAYITGYTASFNFPTAAAQQPQNRGLKDAFILKMNAAGDTLQFSTFFGGGGDDVGTAIGTDGFGDMYVAGTTSSSDFPRTAAFQTTYGGNGDGFVTKLNPAGTVLYSSYIGGTGSDGANAIAVDGALNVLVAGFTLSPDFPVKNAAQPQWSDANIPFTPHNSDAFIVKVDFTGANIVYATYFGGASTGTFSMTNPLPGGADVATGLAVDGAGNAYVTGYTTTTNFPLLDPLRGFSGPTSAGGGGTVGAYHEDAFLASFSSTGSLIYSTDLGGLAKDVGTGVALDVTGAVYVTGFSASSDFPVQTAFQAANGGFVNAFVSKLTVSTPGVRVFFGTSVGGAPYSDANLSATANLTTAGAGCSPGNYTVLSFLKGFGTGVIFQPAASCTVTVTPSASVGGARYAFSSWSDGPTTNPRTIVAPAHGAVFGINLVQQLQLSTTPIPSIGGTIVASPASADGFYAPGTVVTLTAVPNPGYVFSNFTGDLVGITNGQLLTMSTSHSVNAIFALTSPPTVTIESPINGAAISGSIVISGWAIDNATAIGTSITSVQVKVDNAPVGNANYGVLRPEICAVYPGRANCPNVGFTFTLNANSLGTGVHTISVTATDSDAFPDSGTASIQVTSTLAMVGTKVGAFRDNTKFLFDTNGNGLFDQGVDRFIPSFTAPGGALPGDIALTGDWNGDGHSKIGIYRPSTGTWWLDVNNSGVFDAGDATYQFGGLPGDLPFSGDWNSVSGITNNRSCIGIYRSQGSVWLLDLNCNGVFEGTPTDAFFPFGGLAGDVPVVGSWVFGTTRVGVVRKYAPGGVPQGEPFFWVFDAGTATSGNLPANHPAAAGAFPFGGLPGDIFVTGDWNNTGTSKAGIFRGGAAGIQPFQWVLDGSGQHTPDIVFNLFGLTGDKPITGKW